MLHEVAPAGVRQSTIVILGGDEEAGLSQSKLICRSHGTDIAIAQLNALLARILIVD